MEEGLYRTFYEVEKKHWWFVARQRIVEEMINRIGQLPKRASVLDVGCGTGAFLEQLSRKFRAFGTDTSPLAIEFCRQRGLENAFCCTLQTFPHPDQRFDLVTLLDVIEHADDDLDILQQARNFLTTGGFAVVTVPAYQFLWSKHDELNHHKRRYTRKQLQRVLQSAGFNIRVLSYFNSLLFPLAFVQRMIQKIIVPKNDRTLEIPPAFVNSLLTALFATERILLPRFRLPLGLSIIAVAQRSPLRPATQQVFEGVIKSGEIQRTANEE